jgi:histidinol phosphatase-like PHP family hydrolase
MPFKIDLHTHSFFSGDGVSSPEENIASAKAKGLHGFALTDHNTNDGVTYLLEKGLMRQDGLPVDDFLIIPGVEVTQQRDISSALARRALSERVSGAGSMRSHP